MGAQEAEDARIFLVFCPHVALDWKMKNVRRDAMTKRIVECRRGDSMSSTRHDVAAERFLDLLAQLIARRRVCEESDEKQAPPVITAHCDAHRTRPAHAAAPTTKRRINNEQ
jgi:hypothetical protein